MSGPLRPILILPLFFGLACKPSEDPNMVDPNGGFEVANSKAPHDEDPQITAEEAAALTLANHRFGLALYHELSAGQALNQGFSISPYSIQTAFGMLYAGTIEPARSEMAFALRFPLEGERQHVGNNWVDAQLRARNLPALINDPVFGDQDPVILETANGVWIAEDLEPKISPSYLDVLAIHYDAGLFLAQFRSQPDTERLGINAWVSNRTHDLIPELLPAGVITKDTAVVLVNALYLKAPWAVPFDVSLTAEAPFTRLDGSMIDVAMMHAGTLEAGYGYDFDWQALALPMRGGLLELVVILPTIFEDVEAIFDSNALDLMLGGLTTTIVDVKLPRFELESQFELTQELRELGMNAPFDDERSFDAIVPDLGVITTVVHQTVIEVDEKGTQAAAATGIVVGKTSAMEPEVTLVFDRPFFVVIRDQATGTVLFLGRVLEP